tara:strand:- start:1249 stop:2007 length:759 start_codon:yes stop_codon:yes gene_type:complete
MDDNPYNRMIQSQLKKITESYLLHQDKTGKQVLESNMMIPATVARLDYKGGLMNNDKFDDLYEGGIIKTVEGGSFGKRSKTVVSGNLGGAKIGRAVGSGKSEMKGCGAFKKGKKGGNFINYEFERGLEGLENMVQPLLTTLKGGRKRKGGNMMGDILDEVNTLGLGRKRKGGSMGIDAMAAQKNLLTGGKSTKGILTGAKSTRGRLTGNGKKRKNKKGGNFFDDIISAVPAAVSVVNLLKGRGKAKGKKGGS